MSDVRNVTVGDLFDAAYEGVKYGILLGLLVGIVCALIELQEVQIASHALLRDLRNRLPVEPAMPDSPAKESEDAEERS